MGQPTKEDKFSFGLWTVGWRAGDSFGAATRARPWTPWRRSSTLRNSARYGVTFHDDDLIPFGTDEAEREQIVARFRRAVDAVAVSSCR